MMIYLMASGMSIFLLMNFILVALFEKVTIYENSPLILYTEILLLLVILYYSVEFAIKHIKDERNQGKSPGDSVR